MTISFVGAGNLGTHLAFALQAAGHDIACVCANTQASADTLVKRLKLPQECAVTEIGMLKPADLYVLAVPDRVISDISSAWPSVLRQGVVVHTSGATPMDELRTTGLRYGVLYPMQTFSKSKDVDFKSIPCFVEGCDTEVVKTLVAVGQSVSDVVRELDSTNRCLLHVAAVFACNFTNHLYTLAFDLLERQGIDPKCLIPLIDETAEKIHTIHPQNAQTGPALRKDLTTINRHLEGLSNVSSKDTLTAIYQQLTKSIIENI